MVAVAPPDPATEVLVVLVDVMVAGAVLVELVLAETTLLTVPAELPVVSEVELPVSCTPSARAVKPVVPPPCETEGAVGPVMLDCFVFTAAPEIADRWN